MLPLDFTYVLESCFRLKYTTWLKFYKATTSYRETYLYLQQEFILEHQQNNLSKSPANNLNTVADSIKMNHLKLIRTPRISS